MRVPLSLSLLFLIACAPDLTVKTSRVPVPRIVALRAEPAEAKPNTNIHWTAIVVSPAGIVHEANVDWNFCLVPRSPTDSTTISTVCLAPPQVPLDGDVPMVDAGPLPDGSVADAGIPPLAPLSENGMLQVASRIPSDACARVGPQVPPAAADGTRQRPPDPDVTGGYYLPIRMELDGQVGFGRQRLRCALPDVPGQTATDFAAQYHNNTNPVIDQVIVSGLAGPTDGTPIVLDFSAPIAITVTWTPESIEDYVVVDPASRELVPATEHFTVEWFTNGGEMEHDRTTAVDFTTSPNFLQIDPNRYTPATACATDGDCDNHTPYCADGQCVCVRSQCDYRVTVWIVLKDDRGGVDYRTVVLSPG